MVSHSRSFVRAAISVAAIGAAVVASAQVPRSVTNTPGKEYTDLIDVNSVGFPDNTRNIHWDGFGNVIDSIKYETNGQIDALASPGDYLYNEVTHDAAALLISMEGDHGNRSVYSVMPVVGTVGVWATKAQVNSGGVGDVDALEVWGGDGPGSNDAFAYSKTGDAGDVAIWNYTGVIDAGAAFMTRSEIALAIGLGRDAAIDLDALMCSGDSILFSIRAFGIFDGGEIWTYTKGAGPGTAAFLVHGGRVWDTANQVGQLFDCPSENIDGLEAVDIVPEPASMAVLGLGALGLLRRRTKKA